MEDASLRQMGGGLVIPVLAAEHRANEGAAGPLDSVLPEVRRLYGLGYSLLPLGGGDDGKRPSLQFADRQRRLPVAVIERRMLDTGSTMYGVRLSDVVVIDVDVTSEEADRLVSGRFGSSLFQTITSRGKHHWFRRGAGRPPASIRSDSIAIDFKTGGNSYVVGPGSIRPDGFVYSAAGSSLPAARELPVFVDRQQPPKNGSGRVGKSGRHSWLTREAIRIAEVCSTEFDLLEELVSLRDFQCDDPDSVPDSEVEGIAAWAWKKRLSNSLWGGEAVVRVMSSEGDLLQQHPHGADALMLLYVLRRAHEAKPGKRFAIAADAMVRDRVIPSWTRQRYYRSIDNLLEAGLIIRAMRRPGFRSPHSYQLGRRLTGCIKSEIRHTAESSR